MSLFQQDRKHLLVKETVVSILDNDSLQINHSKGLPKCCDM